MRSRIILCFTVLVLLFSCSGKKQYSAIPYDPFFDDGVYFISFKDHSSENIFTGDWGPPQMEKGRGFFRQLQKGTGNLTVNIPHIERYILKFSAFYGLERIKVRINNTQLQLKKGKAFVNRKILRPGKNVISITVDKPVKFSGVDFFPLRALRYSSFKERYLKGGLLMLPGRFKYFINPFQGEFIVLNPDIGKHTSFEFKLEFRSKNGIEKRERISVPGSGSLKIEPVPGVSQVIDIIPISRKVGFLKIKQSHLVSRVPGKDEEKKYFESIKKNSGGKNVLIVLLDAARSDHFGYMGYVRNTTPNINRFTSDSQIFKNVRSQASFTLASTGTLLTGLSPDFHGVISKFYSSLREDRKTLATLFKEKGYFTGAISGNPNFGRSYKYDRDFSSFKELFIDHSAVLAGQFISPFIQMLNDAGKKPFFIYLHIREPHDPFEMPEPYLGKFQDTFKTTDNLLRKFGKLYHKSYLDNNDNRKLLKDIYDENLAYGDAVFGKIVEILKKRGILSNTVIVFLSDHGEAIGEHGMIGHGHVLYKEGIRIPLIIHIPGMGKNVYKEPAITSDLVVTICKLFSLKYPYLNSSYGKNLFFLPKKRRFVVRSINTLNYPSYTVIRYPYKLIVNFPIIPEELVLFNLESDPDEERPISGKKILKQAMLYSLLDHLKRASAFRGVISAPKLRKEDIRSLKSLGYIQ